MKTHYIRAASGKVVPTWWLTYRDTLFCCVIFLVSAIVYLGLRKPLYWLVRKSYKGSESVASILGVNFVTTFWFRIILQLIGLPIICFLANSGDPLPQSYLIFSVLVYGFISLAVVGSFASEDINVKSPVTRNIRKLSSLLPHKLYSSPLTKESHIWYLIATLYLLYQTGFLIFFARGSILFWLVLIPILAFFMYFNLEQVEHVASHSPKGRILRHSKATSWKDWCVVALEWLRIYIFWPIGAWYPDYYYGSHTGIHHRENNAPADFQSMLKFSNIRVSGFIQGVTWYALFLSLIPVDAYRYLKHIGAKRILKRFIWGYVWGWLVFAALYWFYPPVALILLLVVWIDGINTFKLVLRWHGFHDATKAHNALYCGGSPVHTCHHNNMSIHCEDLPHLAKIYWQQTTRLDATAPALKDKFALATYAKHWMLVLSLLWQQKLYIVNQFIFTGTDNVESLRKYVNGDDRIEPISVLDSKLSMGIGQWLEKILKKRLTDREYLLFYPNDQQNHIVPRSIDLNNELEKYTF